ncbi:MAG: endo-1,4-beta-xylanase [Calothrix sp. C42_A2020_038]|nr:endo-1,4-beta-xylanase [Calothrix sp. C42_A2020_038]
MFNNRLCTRRQAIRLGVTAVSGLGLAIGAKKIYSRQEIQSSDYQQKRTAQDFAVDSQTPLKIRAASKGLIYGAAGNYPALSSDANFKSRFVQECGILVPENELKWYALRPTESSFDFSKGDWLAKFARDNGMLFRGHNLVWNQFMPEWFWKTVNKQNAEKYLTEHITTVAKHYAGQVHSWDVVNEVIDPKHGKPYGLANSPWLDFLGPEYIELAFRATAESDPNALLVFNEAGLKYDTSEHEARRTSVLKLLEHLKSKGTPIHAFGTESHILAHETPFNAKKLRTFLSDLASLGLKILITELDVIDQKLPADIKVRDIAVASHYHDYLSVVLEEKAVMAVLTWGLSDRYTWISQFSPRSDEAPVRPLPFDSDLQPKLAWNALAKAFDNAPKR